MVIEDISIVDLETPFKQWLIADKGSHLFPVQYTPNCRNIRVINGATTVRKWYKSISDDEVSGRYVRGITSNQQLYTVYDEKLKRISFATTPVNVVDVGNFSGDYDVNFVNYGQYIICLTWQTFPYVYDVQANTFTQLTNANIESNANPRFWVQFAYLTIVAGSGNNSNNIYISRGITATNPEFAFDRAGTGAEKRELNSNILSLVATLDRVFIFTEKTVEYLDKGSLAAVGSYQTFITSPLSLENQPASHRSVVAADDVVFFLTKTKQIKTLNYTPGVTESQIGELSSRPGRSIQEFLNLLDDDQSQSFGYYNRTENKVYRHVKTQGEPYNNLVIVYDVENDAFLVDNNKSFSCVTELDNKYYAGGAANTLLFQDEVGKDDDWVPIAWRRDTVIMNFGNPNYRKQFRTVGIGWEIDQTAEIDVEVLVDWDTEFTGTIVWDQSGNAGIAASSIWGLPIAGSGFQNQRVQFEELISRGRLRAKGKKIQVKFSWNSIWQDFTLSALSVWLRGIGDTERGDKF